ncbi:MAG: hypothetical protein VW518_10340 [Burkholderiaceae bacterium]
MSDDLVKRLRNPIGAMRPTLTDGREAADRIEELEAKLAKAQALAAAVDRRMNDLGGYDNRFDLRKALQEYRGTTLAELKGEK